MNNTEQYCQCEFRKGDTSANGWKCLECHKEINTEQNNAAQGEREPGFYWIMQWHPEDGGIWTIAQWSAIEWWLPGVDSVEYPLSDKEIHAINETPLVFPPTPSDAIAFAQWIGANQLHQGVGDNWLNKYSSLTAATTADLYKIFKNSKE